jgi:hypothetical protein
MAGGARVRSLAALAHVHDICGDVGEQRSSAARVCAAAEVWRYRVARRVGGQPVLFAARTDASGETPA